MGDDAPVYIVSGGVGASGEQMVRTALAQFPGRDVPLVVVPHVRHDGQVQDVVERAAHSGGLVVHTLVNAPLRQTLDGLAQARGVVAVDLMGDLLRRLADWLGQEPVSEPGLYRQLHRSYFERVDCIEFAVAHDDGQRPADLPLAEIVLLGVSRVGKTPLSMYLSVQGWKVANLPFVAGVALPPALAQVERGRVVGLTIEPGQLLHYRRWRQRRLGVAGRTDYTDATQVYEEVEAAQAFCQRQGYALVDVTDKPIESSAEEVVALVSRAAPAPE